MNDTPIPLNYQSTGEMPLAGWAIIRWWESRRVIYNGVLLILGLLIIAAIVGLSALTSFDVLGPPLFVAFGVFAYGFCANVCYTGGWILDLAWREPDADAAARRRSGVFKAGLIFSCLVTTVPLWFVLGVIVLRHV